MDACTPSARSWADPLWRLLHRKLPLRSHQWVRELNDSSPMCLFCGLQEETYLHLFCTCPFIQPFWSIIYQLLRHMQMKGVRTSPANIVLGNLRHLQQMTHLRWDPNLPPPEHGTITKWAQQLWAVLRLTTLNAIWTLRNQVRTQPATTALQLRTLQMIKLWGQLRTLAVAHRHPPHEAIKKGAQQQTFFDQCWEAIIPIILRRLHIPTLLLG